MGRYNMNAAVKIFLLLGFAAFFVDSIYTGDVSLYVHPRMIPFMIFAAAVMAVMAFLFFGELYSAHKAKINSWPLLFFVVPLIMAYVIPAKAFDSGSVGSVQLSAGASSQTDPADTTESPEAGSTGILLQDGAIVMDDSNFYGTLNELYGNMDKYAGVPIEVVGFVFKDGEGFAEDQFVPARLMMICCAADMVPMGLLCRYEGASALTPDTWVKVTGTLGKTQFDGETIPMIEAAAVEETEKPVNDYIYPY